MLGGRSCSSSTEQGNMFFLYPHSRWRSNLVPRDWFGRPVQRYPAHSPHRRYKGTGYRTSALLNRKSCPVRFFRQRQQFLPFGLVSQRKNNCSRKRTDNILRWISPRHEARDFPLASVKSVLGTAALYNTHRSKINTVTVAVQQSEKGTGVERKIPTHLNLLSMHSPSPPSCGKVISKRSLLLLL